MFTKSILQFMAVLIVFVVVLGWIWFAAFMPDSRDLSSASSVDIERAKLQLEYYKIRQEALQILVVGVAVGLAAIIVPTLLSWHRERFERYKESRQAYSRASTGVHYLPERLAGLNYIEAMQLINEVHEHKHVAETYEELKDQISRRAGNRTQKQWSDNMWKTLEAYQTVVSEEPAKWDQETRKNRLQKLKTALENLRKKIGGEYFT